MPAKEKSKCDRKTFRFLSHCFYPQSVMRDCADFAWMLSRLSVVFVESIMGTLRKTAGKPSTIGRKQSESNSVGRKRKPKRANDRLALFG